VRQLVLIAGVVGVLMYGALVSQRGIPVAAAPLEAASGAPEQGMGALQKGLAAAGALLDEAVITGWVELQRPQETDRVKAALGWNGMQPEGERRAVALRDRNGRQYIFIRWEMRGKAAAKWQAGMRHLQMALEQAVAPPTVTVQLGGPAPGADLPELADRALGALSATDRQPWSDMRAASVAGRTTQLPPGPFGVNVQVAVRHDAATGQTRAWVAWPALLQEY